jgi:RNA polymerase sigma factor FliA
VRFSQLPVTLPVSIGRFGWHPCCYSTNWKRIQTEAPIYATAKKYENAPAEQLPDRETLIENYLPLVKSVARGVARRLPSWIDPDDLISAGCLGLISATERFDPTRGITFGLFAKYRIRWAIMDELRAIDPVSRRRRQRMQHLERTRTELTNELGNPPSDEQLAEQLGLELDEFLNMAGKLTPALEFSLDLLERGAASMLQPEVGAIPSPDRALFDKELRLRLVEAINRLPDRMRTVISLYYYARLNYREIALLLDVTESRICQIHREACQRMRTHLDGD